MFLTELTMKNHIPLVAIGLANIALAQERLPAFEEVDLNQDERIDIEEAVALEGRVDLATADTNQDGLLSREEYTAVAGAERTQSGQSR
jgi:hypothetical protein